MSKFTFKKKFLFSQKKKTLESVWNMLRVHKGFLSNQRRFLYKTAE